MSFNVFLYPQTIFFPLRLLRAKDYIKKCYILELLETKSRMEQFFPELISQIRYISLLEILNLERGQLEKYKKELYNFAFELRDIENLKLFQLHQQLFEETFNLNLVKGIPENPILASILRLIIAEDMDTNLLEVSLALKKFSIDWDKFIKEKILYLENLQEQIDEIKELEREELWDIEKRMRTLKKIFPLLSWREDLDIDTLLISEERVLEELLEERLLIEKVCLSEDISLLTFKEPLNEKIGMPLKEDFPIFNQLLIVLPFVESFI